jgi:hypothetical protein
MRLTVTTWNINSVRLRIDLVAKFVKAVRPDILCLQETKCPDDSFPHKRLRRLGYIHAAINGQKGYHGVAVLSRLPFEHFNVHTFCDKSDCRHISAVFGERAGLRDPVPSSTLGGAIARPTGRRPTRAAGSTTSGPRPHSAIAYPTSPLRGSIAAPSGRPTMCR